MPFVWPGTACDGDRAVFTERERTKLVAPTRDRFQEVVAARLRLALTRWPDGRWWVLWLGWCEIPARATVELLIG